MKIVKIYNDNLSENQARMIAGFMEQGEVIIWPTDTLYAMACDALNVKAIERVCRIKGINPEKTDLSIVCSSISQASEYARIDNNAFRLLKELTPGPYTFIFKASSTLPKVFKGRKTVGIRIPDCETDIAIVEALGHPVLTTSINFDDDDYAVNPELVAETYDSQVDLMIDNGDGSTEASTVINCANGEFELARAGKGAWE